MIDFKDGYGKHTSEYDKAKQFKRNDLMRHTQISCLNTLSTS